MRFFVFCFCQFQFGGVRSRQLLEIRGVIPHKLCKLVALRAKLHDKYVTVEQVEYFWGSVRQQTDVDGW